MNNFPKSDVWWLTDNAPESQTYRTNYKFNFTFFKSEEIKLVSKEYIWTNYTTGSRRPRTLRATIGHLRYFDAFCCENNVHSFRELDNGLVDDYRSFLRLCISPSTGHALSYSSQSGCFSTLKAVVGWCRTFLPSAVQERQIFTGNEYNHVRSQPKINYIPDVILNAVNIALKSEDNIYLKCGIIILRSTGMRIGDLLSLTTGCISEHPISGHTISWFEHKSCKNRNNVPIPKECKEAIELLQTITIPIRERATEADQEKLFIYSPKRARHKKPVVTVSVQTFGRWCRLFCEKHDILDSGGNAYKITSHMFRRSLATDMLSKGVNLKVIQDLLGHTSPSVTRRYYADVKDPERVAMFTKIGVLGDIGQINRTHIPDDADLKWFHENCADKVRLSDGYCTRPIYNGKPCGRFLSRQKCYVCSRYITTLDDLDAHRRHLEELQELLNNNIYGEHYAAHLIPTTLVLQEIIRRLEELQNEH